MSDQPGNLSSADVHQATKIVERLVAHFKAQGYRTPDIGPGITIDHLIDESGIMGPLMMKMDIDCKILTGRALWDVSYIVDRETLFGMSVEDNPSSENGSSELKRTNIPDLLAKHAFKELVSLDHSNRSCRLKSLPIFYLYNFKNEEGSVIELPPMNIVYSVSFNESSMKYWSNYSNSLNNRTEPRP